MYSKYERRTDTRTYEDRRKLYEGVSPLQECGAECFLPECYKRVDRFIRFNLIPFYTQSFKKNLQQYSLPAWQFLDQAIIAILE